MNLLIVEDDVRLASALAHILEEAGHAVDTANDGETGYAYASQGKYDVAILDVMLPKKNGFDIVSDLRRAGIATPVLMLTARDAVPDKIRGLDSGADDYMTKPFSPAELMAHLRALTRRQGEVEFETLRAFNLTLDLTERELRPNHLPSTFPQKNSHSPAYSCRMPAKPCRKQPSSIAYGAPRA